VWGCISSRSSSKLYGFVRTACTIELDSFDIDSKVIFVEGTPGHDDPHDPVVGLIVVRWPHPTKRVGIDTRSLTGEGDVGPQGIFVRDLMVGTELIGIPRQAEIGQRYATVYVDENVLRFEISGGG